MADAPPTNLTKVDDEDETHLHYSASGWVHKQDAFNAFNKTVSITNRTGSSVTFEFQGTQVIAFGKTKMQNIVYVQDSQNPVKFGVSKAHRHMNGYVPIFTLGGLLCANHNVTLLVVSQDLQGNHQPPQMLLDRFEYEPCSSLTPTSTFIPYIPSTSASSQISSMAGNANLPSTSSRARTAKIAGIAISCVVGFFLLLLLFLLLLRCWRRQQRQRRPSAKFTVLPSPRLPPYVVNGAAGVSDEKVFQTGAGASTASGSQTSDLKTPMQRKGSPYLRGYLPDSKEWLHKQGERVHAEAAGHPQSLVGNDTYAKIEHQDI